MLARNALAEALLKLDTRDAVEQAHDHFKDMLRLSRDDNFCIRHLLPALKLRLGRDRDCYRSAAWYEHRNTDFMQLDKHYGQDWSLTDKPDLDLRKYNAFASVELFTSQYSNLAHSVAIILVKIRLLRDLECLQRPVERLISSIVTNTKFIKVVNKQPLLIPLLKAQIEELYYAIERNNSHFWEALLQCEPDVRKDLTAPPRGYPKGTVQAMQVVLKYFYASWAETPGAIDFIRELRSRGLNGSEVLFEGS
ncbi:uncharacterized protein BDZ99DRAFT_560092 [Mytilinidion resinicola]|uniref:Uncharacterized protein n=1 Tax=Mytilinidion resinicola TaxID=574789 RepID=A0A6A6YT40_9PEZI|nr:uncharacterized protein BDZ99DRAFT_560092 [Mytilinidion resinicola]KAF2811728.1 hypothetical protein BDZ99DRAFT_560092 [Mytilinidion resinicola]